MRSKHIVKFSFALFIIGFLSGGFFAFQAQAATFLTVEIGIVGTASAEILEDALDQVEEEKMDGLIIILDTPGGALDATRTMVKSIMAADFPVVVWVGPGGARAGSAGSFITISGHIAAMAPGTNIGAAAPVSSSGQDIQESDIKKKVENDTVAFMESIATARGRNREMAVSFVVNSLSITAEEALEHKVVDLISEDIEGLLSDIHGREVKVQGGETRTIDSEGAKTVAYVKSTKQEFLEILSNPNLFYLLFIAGLIGIGFELTHPGVLVPGVLGGICMVLALIATSVLPVSFGAMILVLVGIGFVIAEAFVPSFGILGIGGIVAFVIGSFLLVDPGNEQGLAVSWSMIASVTLVVSIFGVLVFYLVVKSDRSRIASGSESMIGDLAVVKESFLKGTGRVTFQGEDWRAKSVDGRDYGLGVEVKIVKRKGLELLVAQDSDEKGQDS